MILLRLLSANRFAELAFNVEIWYILSMILYHGSKNGIKGDISPYLSRESCDFGKGFYTGDLPDQPKGLIAGWKDHELYELECNLNGLSLKEFTDDYEGNMDWALFIGFNRLKSEYSDYKNLCKRYESYNSEYDLIKGPIANDKMFQLMERFYSGDLCDKALISGLQQIRLGNQYVFKTEKSCSSEHINIVSERKLTQSEIAQVNADNQNRTKQSDLIYSQLQTRYRRAADVKFYDEILEEWNEQDSD